MNKIFYKNQSGVSLVAVIIITGIVAFGGYAIYMFTNSDMPEDGAMMPSLPTGAEDEKMMDQKDLPAGEADDSMMEESHSVTPDAMIKDDKMMNDEAMMELKFSGQVLAGTSSPLLDFNKADYDKAIASGKLVALYFYANWCPICRAEFPRMEEAFSKIGDDKVVGFRVNYNDNQTDDDERELAREFGVAYQHTKVFVKNGQRILKSPESWNSADVYLSKINENK
jgi:thiol-disulfide isomerase/thioredoxin